MAEKYKIIMDIKHGHGEMIYSLKEGQIVPSKIFSSKDIARLISRKLIEISTGEVVEVKTAKVAEIPDISPLSTAETRDLLEGVTNATLVEKLFDQENSGKGRKPILTLLDKRMKELSAR